MIPEIKICGITKTEEILFINEMPVSYIGFVFAQSKRRVTPDQAVKLSEGLRGDIKRVGVFTDTPLSEIALIVKHCSLDVIQLHSECLDKDISSLSCPVWKGISMQSPDCIEKLNEYPSAKAFVLDAYMPDKSGGTGRTFHWEWAEGLSRDNTIVLAGGLNAENVGRAVGIVKPHIVDVSSGVEGLDGKDKTKVLEFIKAVNYA